MSLQAITSHTNVGLSGNINVACIIIFIVSSFTFPKRDVWYMSYKAGSKLWRMLYWSCKGNICLSTICYSEISKHSAQVLIAPYLFKMRP